MESSSLKFMTCDELREEFTKCIRDAGKRILILDVRDAVLYQRSHLNLDPRTSTSEIVTKMRVMNINPDLVKACTSNAIYNTILTDEKDKRVFNLRRDATDVIIIDRNTDDIDKLNDPRSKTMRLIGGLTKYDNQPDKKITVPIKILQGGYREWLLKYPHFTTDSTFDPDAEPSDFKSPASRTSNGSLLNNDHTPSAPIANGVLPANDVSNPTPSVTPMVPRRDSPQPIAPNPPPRPAISKPVVTPTSKPEPVIPPKPIKIAPGTAMPVSPSLLVKPTLPRSNSSPNVAQAEGDTFGKVLDEFVNKLVITQTDHHDKRNILAPTDHTNTRTVIPTAPQITLKPRFDRTLKPPINSESINLIRAQIDLGRCPESSGRPITGLVNLGNTCFLNSVIQCLAYAPDLVDYFCSTYYNDIDFNSRYGTRGQLAIEFGTLVDKLNSRRYRNIEPKSFWNAVKKHLGFVDNVQQDSHEFMMMLFDKLHHDLNIHAKYKSKQNGVDKGNSDDGNIDISRAKIGYQFSCYKRRHLESNRSIVSDLFEGIFMSTLSCTFCAEQSNTFEVFNCLSLPIPSEKNEEIHVKDCLSHFSNPERIEAAWECPRCKQKRDADKKIVICNLPRILIIHLKRFSVENGTKWRNKLGTRVDFPLKNLAVKCTNISPQSADRPIEIEISYNLCAVVNHYGNLDGGHYTAFGKLQNQRWYTFDDGTVSEMKDSDVCSQAAYILFYSR